MDYDRLFKELITTFFASFIELFVPKMAAALDPASVEFLDKEVFTDIGASDRHEVDLLVKARLSGDETFILIHVENQSKWQSDFPKRMFRYFSLLHVKFDLPLYPIALFSYDRPLTPATDKYGIELFDLSVLRYQYHPIQLNRLNWRDFLNTPNPVASALMTKMNIAPEDRPRVKLECLRMLATLKLDLARAALIGTFMKSYLVLTAAEQVVYNRAAEAIDPEERKTVMQYTTEWEDQGILKGKLEGELNGRLELVKRQLRRRFGDIPAEMPEALGHLTTDQLDDFAEALLDFKTLADAEAWIAQSHVS